jgi:lambda family phage tail tape measure protein
MDLAELKFIVDTKQLEDAAKKVAELGTAVSKVNKPMQDLTKESAKSNKELSKAEEAAAKAALAQLKLQQAQEKSTDSTTKSASVLERQNLILEYMAQGNSKGQASILATAKAAGALDDEMLQLNNTLKTQRTLIGGDPFDKSIGLMQKLQNEYKTTTEVSNLFNKNLGLTEKQMVDLAREKERLIALYGIEGRSLNGLAAEYDQLISKSVAINQANDARTNSMKAQVKAQNDAAKANDYLTSEMERVNKLTASNGDITSATNNKLIKFEQALKASGATASEQISKLEAYKTALLATQKAAGNRQVDYLSRALGPQITDIFVGLATGQSPMMVLLQQGGQLRDQFALAGVAGKDMGDMLTKATLGMVSSVKDVGVAVGSALVGAFLAAGKSVKTFVMDITGTSSALEYMRYQIALLDGSNGLLMRSFLAFGGILTGVIAAGIFSAVAAFVAYGVALKQVINEESALSKAVNLTGGSLGLTTDSAIALSEAYAGSKGNVGAYVTAITEIAKAGGITSDNLKTVATTIVEVSRVTGISSDSLAKNFSKISEKPLEGLIPFAKELGTINVSVLRHIQQLERAGKHTEAAKIATEAYAGALRDASKAIKQDMGFLEDFFFHVARGANMVWNEILNIGRATPLAKKLVEAQKELASLEAGEGFMTDQYRKNSIQGAKAVIEGIEKQIAAQKKLGDEKAKNTADVTKLEKGLKTENKGIEDQQKFDEKIVRQATEAYLTQIGALDHLTKSEVTLLKLRTDPLWEKTPKTIKDQVEALYGAASANERLVEAEKDRVAQMNAIATLESKADGFGKEYYVTLKQLDNAYVDGNISLEKYIELLNKLYQTTPQAKAFATAQSDHLKTMAEITSSRASVSMEFGGDFKTADEKAAIKNLSDYRKSTANADAIYAKQVADAQKNMTGTNLDQAKEMYKAEAEQRKALAEDTYNREQYLLSDSHKRNKAYSTAFEDMFKGMGDAIIDFALTGKSSFGDMVESMIMNLIKLEMQMQMSSMLKGMGGSSGIISAITSALGGGGGTTMSQLEYATISGFAKGGTFTNSIVDSPTMFKFAKGTGLMGEAGPEAIMPLRRGSDGSLGVVASGGSGGNVSVQVINNSNAQATTNETVDSKGNRKIEVVIGDMTAGEISRNGSASQKSIKSTFGLQPQLIRR